jgi:large subunit ribosomal protein L22
MKASLRSVRIAPKKASLVAKMIRGQSVPDAVHILEHTNKKAARIFQDLLRSAMANASHNEKQDPQMMVIKLLTVNKAQAYHRGVPMARGRVRPMRKFLSHINLTLGLLDEPKTKKPAKNASQTAKKPVKKTEKKPSPASAKAPAGKTSTKSKSKADTTPSTSKSSASKKATPKSSSTKK